MKFHRSSMAFLKQAASRLRYALYSASGLIQPLPADFDPERYLELNPDVKKAGLDAALHYMRFGHREKRPVAYTKVEVDGAEDFRPDRDTILVVSHEASRTGAPVLSLNLVQGLVGRYNVVALLLGEGPLTESFRAAGAGVLISPNLRGQPALASAAMRDLCRSFRFRFAVVNSIESRDVLPELAQQFVPTVTLIHEFACYTRPRWVFKEALLWSGEVVFSTKLTRDNAFAEHPELSKRDTHILPQGRCLPPVSELSQTELDREIEQLRRRIRPPGAQDSVVILGAGAVHLRKGIDAFIGCAARVVRAEGGSRCRFVWIGKGFDPENDVHYSVYLAEQIRRSGLQDHVSFIDETSAIETAYKEADLLLLSSRLDPLPNVAIDALMHGVPVLSFDQASGISDFLIEIGLRELCVAGYLDTAEMAEKILALAQSPTLRAQVAQLGREHATAYFRMDRYVAQIEQLAEQAVARARQEKSDLQLIVDSGVYRPDFASPLHQAEEPLTASVRSYVRGWAAGIGQRQPFPGFQPGIYLEQHGVKEKYSNPLADYLRAGRPAGPWNVPVIDAASVDRIDLPEDRRIALHLHVYYPELLPEIIDRLTLNRVRPDLFISVPTEAVRRAVAAGLSRYRGNVVDIRVVKNRGRDIGPLLTAFGAALIADYDFIGHLHTKKSASVKDAAMGRIWFHFLLENLLGGKSGAMADRILTRMKQDSALGMVFPDEPHVVGMNDNRTLAEAFAKRIGLDRLPEHFVFPVGTMFWARAKALQPMMDLHLGWEDYPEEPLPYDGTVLHALERLFSLSLPGVGLRYAVTNVSGVTR